MIKSEVTFLIATRHLHLPLGCGCAALPGCRNDRRVMLVIVPPPRVSRPFGRNIDVESAFVERLKS